MLGIVLKGIVMFGSILQGMMRFGMMVASCKPPIRQVNTVKYLSQMMIIQL